MPEAESPDSGGSADNPRDDSFLNGAAPPFFIILANIFARFSLSAFNFCSLVKLASEESASLAAAIAAVCAIALTTGIEAPGSP